MNNFQVVEINQDIMDHARELLENYSLSQGLKIPDAIIAATSIFHGIPFFTHNKKDFKFIPNIDLFK